MVCVVCSRREHLLDWLNFYSTQLVDSQIAHFLNNVSLQMLRAQKQSTRIIKVIKVRVFPTYSEVVYHPPLAALVSLVLARLNQI